MAFEKFGPEHRNKGLGGPPPKRVGPAGSVVCLLLIALIVLAFIGLAWLVVWGIFHLISTAGVNGATGFTFRIRYVAHPRYRSLRRLIHDTAQVSRK
jgi:hypothetical protein